MGKVSTNEQLTTYRILDATILNADVDAAAAIAFSKLAALASAKLLVGSGSNVPTEVAMSGDTTIDNAGAVTIGTDKVTTTKILDSAVTGAKLPDDAVGYFETATEVEVDGHVDSSPKDLLVADASNDRLVMVQAIASETAAGGPEFDVGSQTTDTDAAFDDIGAGVWVIGERWTGYCLLPATEKLQCIINTAGTAGKIKFRSVVLIPKVQTAQIADGAVTSGKLDESTIKYASVEISSAELLALFTTPKQLVAAPGEGKVLAFDSMICAYDYGTVAYTVGTAGNFQVKHTNASGQAVSESRAKTGFIDQSADVIWFCPSINAASGGSGGAAANTALVLALTGANPTDGDGTIHVKVAYRVHATGL